MGSERSTSTLRLSDQERGLADRIARQFRIQGRGNAIRKALGAFLDNQATIDSLRRENWELRRELADLRAGLKRLDQSLLWVTQAAAGSGAGKPGGDEEE